MALLIASESESSNKFKSKHNCLNYEDYYIN